jgi:hypothetical protein
MVSSLSSTGSAKSKVNSEESWFLPLQFFLLFFDIIGQPAVTVVVVTGTYRRNGAISRTVVESDSILPLA